MRNILSGVIAFFATQLLSVPATQAQTFCNVVDKSGTTLVMSQIEIYGDSYDNSICQGGVLFRDISVFFQPAPEVVGQLWCSGNEYASFYENGVINSCVAPRIYSLNDQYGNAWSCRNGDVLYFDRNGFFSNC